MKLTLSNERIVNTINTLGELSNAKLPVKVAYAITKNINKINVELEAYNKEKAKLINKYGEKDEKGKSVGLKNVYRRLSLYYGDRMTFDIESVVGRGTICRICIPL